MRKSVCILVAVVMVFAFSLKGAIAEGLSRDKAKRMIIEQIKPQEQLVVSFSHLPLGSGLSESELSEAEKQGLLKVGQIQSNWRKEITITDEGKKYLISKEGTNCTVKIVEVHFGEITGIISGGKHATVEFTQIFKNVTPFGKIMRFKEGKIYPKSAEFLLYDDGWRIQGVSYTKMP
jgi:hypothetical protein